MHYVEPDGSNQAIAGKVFRFEKALLSPSDTRRAACFTWIQLARLRRILVYGIEEACE